MRGWVLREPMLRDPASADIPTIVRTGDSRLSQRTEQLQAVARVAKPFEIDDLAGGAGAAWRRAAPPRDGARSPARVLCYAAHRA